MLFAVQSKRISDDINHSSAPSCLNLIFQNTQAIISSPGNRDLLRAAGDFAGLGNSPALLSHPLCSLTA